MAHITNEQIDPELRTMGKIVRPMTANFTAKTFHWQQNFMNRFMKGHFPKDLNVSERYIQRPDGTQMRLLIVVPHIQKPLATGVLWVHGGGYAIETPEIELSYARKVLAVSNSVLVFPDYRLSTEAPFPAAVDDGYLALEWLHDHTQELGVNPMQLFIAGGSAGGGLTAALSLMARDRGEIDIAFQMPLFPMLDDRPTESNRDNDAPVWNTNNNISAWKLYLGADYGTDAVSKYAAPARETDYSGLPPTYTYIGTIEPFYDETVRYIEQLRAAGVHADIDIYPGAFHAFEMFASKTKIAQEATANWQRHFQYAAEHYYTGLIHRP